MKRLCAAGILLICFRCFSQSSIPLYPLQISLDKTTTIIFPYSIISVDLGSQDVLAQKAKGIENVLQLKANKKDFHQTNVSVFTADGKLYPFMVTYFPDPSTLNLSFATSPVVQITDEPLNPALLDSVAKLISVQKQFLHKKTYNEDVRLTLKGIYINENLLWLSFDIRNYSLIEYRPDYLQFSIRDKRQAKRTAIQETRLTPVYMSPFPAIPGHEHKQWIIGFKHFTIPRDKRLICEISEAQNGRLLILMIRHRSLFKARAPVP